MDIDLVLPYAPCLGKTSFILYIFSFGRRPKDWVHAES